MLNELELLQAKVGSGVYRDDAIVNEARNPCPHAHSHIHTGSPYHSPIYTHFWRKPMPRTATLPLLCFSACANSWACTSSEGPGHLDNRGLQNSIMLLSGAGP